MGRQRTSRHSVAEGREEHHAGRGWRNIRLMLLLAVPLLLLLTTMVVPQDWLLRVRSAVPGVFPSPFDHARITLPSFPIASHLPRRPSPKPLIMLRSMRGSVASAFLHPRAATSKCAALGASSSIASRVLILRGRSHALTWGSWRAAASTTPSGRYAIAYCTCPSGEVVEKLSQALLERKLVACISSWPVTSQFVWEGKVQKETEHLMMIKTRCELDLAPLRLLLR